MLSKFVALAQGPMLRRLPALVTLRLRNRRPTHVSRRLSKLQNPTVAQIRAAYVLDNLDAPVGELAHVATLLSTNRPERLSATLRTLARQKSCRLEIIVATHGFSASDSDRQLARDLGLRPKFIEADQSLTLGEVYNLILDSVTAPFLAKIDDDDFYGDYYIADSVRNLKESGADITGKDAIFVYSAQHDATYVRMSHKHNRFVYSLAGGTIVTFTRVARDLGFVAETIGEDQDFLARAFDSGLRLYASTPFGFALNRGTHNTWDAGAGFLDAHTTKVHDGLPGSFECVATDQGVRKNR